MEKTGNRLLMESALSELPHGEGFRFIDRLLDLSPGESGTGEWKVKSNECFSEGHFPDNPIVPGVIMIEALAQLAGVVASSAEKESPGYLLTAVRAVKITDTAPTGSVLLVHVDIKGILGGLVQASGTVSEAGRELMRGEVVLAATTSPGSGS